MCYTDCINSSQILNTLPRYIYIYIYIYKPTSNQSNGISEYMHTHTHAHTHTHTHTYTCIYLCNCITVYIECIQSLNNRVSLHKSSITLPENRKLCVSKHLYKCSNENFKIIPIYWTDDYTLLQIKEKNFIDKFKPTLN